MAAASTAGAATAWDEFHQAIALRDGSGGKAATLFPPRNVKFCAHHATPRREEHAHFRQYFVQSITHVSGSRRCTNKEEGRNQPPSCAARTTNG